MNSFLPDQFQFSHKYSMDLVRYLANLIIWGEENDVYSIPLNFKNEEHAYDFSQIKDIGIDTWLKKYGYCDEFEKMILMSLYPALLSDLYMFLSEALSCSERARLTVTFALLRKPLRDNLFYMEWLLAEPRKFIDTYYDKDPFEYSLDKFLGSDKEIVRRIIRNAIDRMPKRKMIDPDVIYNFRYNKDSQYSLYLMWNKALHLNTHETQIKTENRNLNFIFTNDEDRENQWKYLYSFLPVVLDYAVDVAEALMVIISGKERPGNNVDSFHRELGFSVWSKEMIDWQNNPTLSSEMPNDLDDLHIACPKCNKKIDMDEHLARTLFLDKKMKCPKCLRKITIEAIVDKNGL